MSALGKHKYYCEMCKKQCKDENAFRQHKQSSQHQRNMMEFHQDPSTFIERYSEDLEKGFCELFRIKFGFSNFVPATKAYNEYIKDPHHTHLNSTKWANLTELIMYLQEEGKFEVRMESIQGGGEQFMIKMIDKNEESKKQISQKDRIENIREMERKREQKELEKIIAKANKMQSLQQGKILTKNDEQKKQEEHVQLNDGMIEINFSGMTAPSTNFQNQSISQSQIKAQSSQLSGTKRFMKDEEDSVKDELLKLQQKSSTHNKVSVLDKLIQHSGQQSLQNKSKHPFQHIDSFQIYKNKQNEAIKEQKPQDLEEFSQPPTWCYKGLIVKIKNIQSDNYKEKAFIIDAQNINKIKIQLIKDKSMVLNVHENELDRVIPGEGGIALLLKSPQQLCQIQEVNVKLKELTVKIVDEKNEDKGKIMKVKFDDLCKFNQ